MGKEEKNRLMLKIVCFLVLGVVLLAIILRYSPLMINSQWVPVIGSSPNSLLCQFDKLDFSKETTTSNITGESYVLLHVAHDNEEIDVYTTQLSIDDIQTVGFVSWNNGFSYAIASKAMTSGHYVIGSGSIVIFGNYKTEQNLYFLNIDEIHTPTTLEEIIVDYPELARTVLVLLLTFATSLVFVSFADIATSVLKVSADKENS